MSTTKPLKQPLQVLSLSPSGKLLAVAYGGAVQLVDVQSGKLLATSSPGDSHKANQNSSCWVRHLVWYKDEKLVSTGEDKIVKEWAVEAGEDGTKLVLREERELPKRANAISITQDGSTMVIADKFGDVYAFPMHGCTTELPAPPVAVFPSEPSTSSVAPPAPATETTYPTSEAVKPIASDKKGKRHADTFKPADGQRRGNNQAPEWRHVPARISSLTPVLGHVSMLTAMLILEDGRESSKSSRIVTADRDEHIRVGKWPEGWKVERFLLGQKKFVSSLAIHPSNPNLLLSAGGDDTVRVWDLTTYKCIDKTSFSLEPLKGTAEVKIEIAPTTQGHKARKRMNKKAAKQQQQAAKKLKSEAKGGDATNPGAEAEGTGATPEVEEEHEQQEAAPSEDKKFVSKLKKLDIAIRKMLFLAGPSGTAEDGVLVLSSVGSSALLAYPTASFLAAGTKPEPTQYQLLKLDHPVLDITAGTSSSHLFVSLDVSTASSSTSSSSSSSSASIQCFSLSTAGQLELSQHPAVQTLLEQCSIKVSEKEPYPNTMALYPDISLLSKDPSDSNAVEGDGHEGQPAEGDDGMIVEEE